MQRERLGDHDQPADGEVVDHRRQGDVADLGAFLAKVIQGRVDAGEDRRPAKRDVEIVEPDAHHSRRALASWAAKPRIP